MSIRHVTLIMCEGGKGRRLFNTFTAYHANHSQNIFLEIADRSWTKIIRLFLPLSYFALTEKLIKSTKVS